MRTYFSDISHFLANLGTFLAQDRFRNENNRVKDLVLETLVYSSLMEVSPKNLHVSSHVLMLPVAILATDLINMENYTNASNVYASGEADMSRIVMESHIHQGHFDPSP